MNYWFRVFVSPGLRVVAGGEAALLKGKPHPILSGSASSATKCNIEECHFILYSSSYYLTSYYIMLSLR